jgi:hypothetical protein
MIVAHGLIETLPCKAPGQVLQKSDTTAVITAVVSWELIKQADRRFRTVPDFCAVGAALSLVTGEAWQIVELSAISPSGTPYALCGTIAERAAMLQSGVEIWAFWFSLQVRVWDAPSKSLLAPEYAQQLKSQRRFKKLMQGRRKTTTRECSAPQSVLDEMKNEAEDFRRYWQQREKNRRPVYGYF